MLHFSHVPYSNACTHVLACASLSLSPFLFCSSCCFLLANKIVWRAYFILLISSDIYSTIWSNLIWFNLLLVIFDFAFNLIIFSSRSPNSSNSRHSFAWLNVFYQKLIESHFNKCLVWLFFSLYLALYLLLTFVVLNYRIIFSSIQIKTFFVAAYAVAVAIDIIYFYNLLMNQSIMADWRSSHCI